MVGTTGLKPGAIEKVRSPQGLRIDLNAVGLKVPPQHITLCLVAHKADLLTFYRYTRIFRLYRDISFDMYRSPCQRSCAGGNGGKSPSDGGSFIAALVDQSKGQVLQGELDDRSLGLRGFFSHAQNLKSRIYRLIGPPSSSRGWRGRGKAEGQGDGEVC